MESQSGRPGNDALHLITKWLSQQLQSKEPDEDLNDKKNDDKNENSL